MSKNLRKYVSLILCMVMLAAVCLIAPVSVSAQETNPTETLTEPATEIGTEATDPATDVPTDEPTSGDFIRYMLGDANLDEAVNLKDILLVQNYKAKVVDLTSRQMLGADIDGDLNVSIQDILFVQKYLASMKIDYAVGEWKTVSEIPEYPTGPSTEPTTGTEPEQPTGPSTEPTTGTEPVTEAPTPGADEMVLYVSNAVSWLTNDGCKLWAYNTDTEEFKVMAIDEENKFFSVVIPESWQNIDFYRSTFGVDETNFSIDLPAADPEVGMPNKWVGVPARTSNDCFTVTADGAGVWGMYDPNPSADAATIYFDNTNTQWEKVYVYGWSFGLHNEFVEMESIGNNLYKYTFPEAPTPGVNGFLFVNGDAWGGQQTLDVATAAGKNLYTNLTGTGTAWTGTWDVYGE